MENNKAINRWFIVFGAVIIQLALGALYAWSLFTKALKEAPYNFTTAQTQAIFTAAIVTFAIVMIFAGIQMKKFGPRSLTIVGAFVLGGGYILGSLFGSSFLMQFICIGIISGAGIGLAYVVPIAVGIKWFPDHKGFISGLAVAGFGFGATIWVKVGGSWFGLVESFGVQTVYLYYGIAFIIMVLIGSIWMVNPPEGYLPEGYTPPETTNNVSKKLTASRDFTWQKMLSKFSFWLIWLIFIFSGMAGLLVIGTIRLFGIDALQTSGMEVAAAGAAAGTAMAWYAIFNGLGRIIWGKISDHIGPETAIVFMCLIQGILMLTFYKMGTTAVMLAVYASAIGFNFGGNFALFPVATADLFGTKNVGSNYPFVFTAYGIAGIAGPMLGGFVRDHTGTFLMAFVPAGIACFIGSVLALIIKPLKAELQTIESERLKAEGLTAE